jgi:hypothetical protein
MKKRERCRNSILLLTIVEIYDNNLHLYFSNLYLNHESYFLLNFLESNCMNFDRTLKYQML